MKNLRGQRLIVDINTDIFLKREFLVQNVRVIREVLGYQDC